MPWLLLKSKSISFLFSKSLHDSLFFTSLLAPLHLQNLFFEKNRWRAGTIIANDFLINGLLGFFRCCLMMLLMLMRMRMMMMMWSMRMNLEQLSRTTRFSSIISSVPCMCVCVCVCMTEFWNNLCDPRIERRCRYQIDLINNQFDSEIIWVWYDFFSHFLHQNIYESFVFKSFQFDKRICFDLRLLDRYDSEQKKKKSLKINAWFECGPLWFWNFGSKTKFENLETRKIFFSIHSLSALLLQNLLFSVKVLYDSNLMMATSSFTTSSSFFIKDILSHRYDIDLINFLLLLLENFDLEIKNEIL